MAETDLISRQAAIDALDQIFDRCEEIEAHLPEGDPDRTGYKMYPDYMTVWKYLHQFPSAQPERTGKWIEMGTNKDGTHSIRCSKCGGGYKTRGHARSIATKAKYKFCPNCGADMRGGQDG